MLKNPILGIWVNGSWSLLEKEVALSSYKKPWDNRFIFYFFTVFVKGPGYLAGVFTRTQNFQ